MKWYNIGVFPVVATAVPQASLCPAWGFPARNDKSQAIVANRALYPAHNLRLTVKSMEFDT
ncbi:hypothetical protein BZZ01_24275 [Nostocales cyanobacterium HT-58-2]|nr:hypothetical protein BZZ01_24275 [Nostocales cyanobacterium HT-58-2]